MSRHKERNSVRSRRSRRWMTVQQVARILRRSENAIWLALERGVLKGRKRGRRWFLATIQILRIIYSHPANRCHVWASELAPKKFKISRNSTRHLAKLKRYSPEEDLRKIPLLFDGEQIEPREAAIILQDRFASMARELVPRNWSLQDDVIQEMSLAVLEQQQNGNREFFMTLAVWRARDFLRRERYRGGISLDEISQLLVDSERISDETLVQALLDDGHDVEMIEEILGCRLVTNESPESQVRSLVS